MEKITQGLSRYLWTDHLLKKMHLLCVKKRDHSFEVKQKWKKIAYSEKEKECFLACLNY